MLACRSCTAREGGRGSSEVLVIAGVHPEHSQPLATAGHSSGDSVGKAQVLSVAQPSPDSSVEQAGTTGGAQPYTVPGDNRNGNGVTRRGSWARLSHKT